MGRVWRDSPRNLISSWIDMRPGVTIGQAAADLARLIPIALHSYPPQPGFTVKAFEDVRLTPRLETLKNNLVGDLSKTL